MSFLRRKSLAILFVLFCDYFSTFLDRGIEHPSRVTWREVLGGGGYESSVCPLKFEGSVPFQIFFLEITKPFHKVSSLQDWSKKQTLKGEL